MIMIIYDIGSDVMDVRGKKDGPPIVVGSVQPVREANHHYHKYKSS